MKILSITFLCLLGFFANRIEAKSTIDDADYVAAVISYTPVPFSNKTTPAKIVQENLKNYLDLIYQTKDKNVDILVFPEATLNYWGFHNDRDALLEVGVSIPEVGNNDTNFVDDFKQGEIMSEISKRAKENEMYILINVVEVAECGEWRLAQNLHEVGADQPRAEAFTDVQGEGQAQEKDSKCGKDGKILYNTNVVFDRNGTIVSKYRKFNLFNEKVVATEEKPELATFTTDFGIQFGHFICFDIIFRKPAIKLVQNNVRHILYPTLWFSELPFITAAQVQAAWANANNVVLLASGGNNPQYGSSGSGIYVGKHGAMKVLMSPNKEKRVMIAKVPKNPDIQELDMESGNKEFSPKDMEKFYTEQFDVKGVHQLESPKTQLNCEDYLCCSYEINYQRLDSQKRTYFYKAASALNERRPSPQSLVKEAYCAVLSCTDANDPKSCGRRFADYKDYEKNTIVFDSVKIQAKFDMSNNMSLLAMPSTLDTSLLPLSTSLFDFHIHTVDEDDKHYQIYTLETKTNATLSDFLTFGIHTRIFSGADSEDSGATRVSSHILLAILVITWICSLLS